MLLFTILAVTIVSAVGDINYKFDVQGSNSVTVKVTHCSKTGLKNSTFFAKVDPPGLNTKVTEETNSDLPRCVYFTSAVTPGSTYAVEWFESFQNGTRMPMSANGTFSVPALTFEALGSPQELSFDDKKWKMTWNAPKSWGGYEQYTDMNGLKANMQYVYEWCIFANNTGTSCKNGTGVEIGKEFNENDVKAKTNYTFTVKTKAYINQEGSFATEGEPIQTYFVPASKGDDSSAGAQIRSSSLLVLVVVSLLIHYGW